MRIQEIIFQGVFDCDSPVRVATAPGVDRMNLPAGLNTEQSQALLIALLYPEWVPEPLGTQLGGGGKVKLAVVMDGDSASYRVLRRAKPGSFRLQEKHDGNFQTIAKGREATAEALQEKLGLPDFESFAWLNLWRFDDDELVDTGPQYSEDDVRLIEKYREAVKVEALEDQIKSLEGDLEQNKSSLGKGAKLEEKLRQARQKLEDLQLSDLSDEDLDLIHEKDERLEEFNHQLDRLERQEEEEREDVEAKVPDRPWKKPLFWVGLAIGAAALGASIAMHDSLRQVAAVNLVGFGLVAWVLLKYFTDLERASVHQVRLESIKRRLNQVREEQVSFGEKINHVLIHAGVDNEHELFERVEKSERLEEVIEQMEAKIGRLERDPSYQEAKDTSRGIEEHLEELRAERALLPDFVMSTFQLESDLKSVGITPHEVLSEDEEEEEDEIPQTPFARLKLVAERTGQWKGSGLQPRSRKMWGKIAGHVLGERFKGVDLTNDGALSVREMSDDQLDMWRRTRGSEERIVAAALALALHVNVPNRSSGLLETIWIEDPKEQFGSKVSDAFDDVFESAAKKSHIVLCN